MLRSTYDRSHNLLKSDSIQLSARTRGDAVNPSQPSVGLGFYRGGCTSLGPLIKMVYKVIRWWYSSCMIEINTATAILTRLFVDTTGEGLMMAFCKPGMRHLALLLREESELSGYARIREYPTRLVWLVRRDALRYIVSVTAIPVEALYKDREALTEMMNRVAASGVKTRPLTLREFEHLQKGLGHGNWCRGIAVIGEIG